jgi:TRAP-type C4-dicarboxylate transport system substrate-binding protein
MRGQSFGWMISTMRVGGIGQPLALALAVAVGAAGCGGGGTDKAGGSAPPKPLVLTLATHDDDEASGTFAAAVARLSGGSLRIRIEGNWRASQDRREIDYERGIVEDVRAGKAQLGIFGVRVWDTLGVTSFQALLAPFLIDSLSLERAALQSPLAAKALARVGRQGVVGIALVPGRLRRPLGLTRSLLRPRDYRGAVMGFRIGAVAEATYRTLGARPQGYIPGYLSGFDGTDLDPLTITENNYDVGARGLTANVVFWPKPQTIVMNRAAFERLTPEQQGILIAAGRAALAPELKRIARDQQLGLSNLCAAGFQLATASPTDLVALRRAVRPVYDRIERNPFTKRWIAEIVRVRGSSAPDVARCPTQ